MPSAFAVFRLMISSNFVAGGRGYRPGCCLSGSVPRASCGISGNRAADLSAIRPDLLHWLVPRGLMMVASITVRRCYRETRAA
jgi:hypothetical protein